MRDDAAPALPELPIQYPDYAVWQRNWLQGDVLDKELQYWRTQLEGLETLELPTDNPRPAVLTRRGGRIQFHISAEEFTDLEAVARKQNVTLFMNLLVAFQVVLGRWAGQRDVVVGTDIANRNRLETENLIGFFVNQLVLRSHWSDGVTFKELLRHVRETLLGAYEHQNVPFEKLVEELEPQRELNRAPLFQVKLVLQNAPHDTQINIEGLEFSPFHEELGDTIKVDLHLMFMPAQNGITGLLTYSQDLFNQSTAERLATHVQVLLNALPGQIDLPVDEFELVTDKEREQLLFEWNGKQQFDSDLKFVHEMLAEHAQVDPNTMAIEWDGGRCTYSELNRRSNQLAHYLRAIGVGPEARVGLYGNRCIEMIVGLFGILKSGGAYVPLDGDCPKERLGWMIEELGIGVVVTQSQYRDAVPGYWIQTVCLDCDWHEIAKESTEALVERPDPDNLAYAIYTSGSTGKAKAVGIAHRQLSHYVRTMGEKLGLDQCASFCLVSSLAADLGYTALYPAIANGARLHLAPDWESGKMQEYLEKTNVDCLKITPTHLRAMIDKEGKARVLPRKRLVIGGEASELQWVQWLRSLDPQREIWNHYGPTESTIGVTAYNIASSPDAKRGRVPIGRGISNSETYVLDHQMRLVPVGVAGELYIGGAGLARGYLNRPELTAEKFAPNPFGGSPGERLYRTGDRARWRIDGDLEYLGRIDEQVKIRGYRIEPGEITAMLREHAGVKEAMVVVQQDASAGKRLVGYVVGKSGERELHASELRSYLQERLPDYMVPAKLVVLDSMPLLPNGKVNRRALPVADIKGEEKNYIAPQDAVEETIANIWGEVLAVAQVGVEDNFFELGGHSLLATQVVARISDVFGIELPLHLLFEAPTVAGLAERLRQQGLNLEQLLAEVESLSDDEIESFLTLDAENETN